MLSHSKFPESDPDTWPTGLIASLPTGDGSQPFLLDFGAAGKWWSFTNHSIDTQGLMIANLGPRFWVCGWFAARNAWLDSLIDGSSGAGQIPEELINSWNALTSNTKLPQDIMESDLTAESVSALADHLEGLQDQVTEFTGVQTAWTTMTEKQSWPTELSEHTALSGTAVSALADHLESLQGANKELESSVTGLQEEKENLEEEVATLKDQVTEFTGVQTAWTNVIAGFNNPRPDGVGDSLTGDSLVALVDHLTEMATDVVSNPEVVESWTAFAEVLPESLQDIVTDGVSAQTLGTLKDYVVDITETNQYLQKELTTVVSEKDKYKSYFTGACILGAGVAVGVGIMSFYKLWFGSGSQRSYN
jgi:hypothetical protein